MSCVYPASAPASKVSRTTFSEVGSDRITVAGPGKGVAVGTDVAVAGGRAVARDVGDAGGVAVAAAGGVVGEGAGVSTVEMGDAAGDGESPPEQDATRSATSATTMQARINEPSANLDVTALNMRLYLD
jgi:hypothetical protein